MALNIRLKPHEQIIIGGAVIRNGDRAADLFVENTVPILRRKDIMSESEATTATRRAYFEIQLMYIDPERQPIHAAMLKPLLHQIADTGSDQVAQTVANISALVQDGQLYQALKATRQLIILEDAQAIP